MWFFIIFFMLAAGIGNWIYENTGNRPKTRRFLEEMQQKPGESVEDFLRRTGFKND